MTGDGTSAAITTSTLVGRDAELAHLRRTLATAATGSSAVLAVRGPAGIGKTALIEHVAAAAGEHRVIRVRGVAAEADLPYSALHLLASALQPELARLERHQREAIEAAVGLRAGPVPGRLVVGVALVELLRLAAGSRPLLCVADDTHWLDPASAEVLTFATRHVGPAPVALVFAGRGDCRPGLPEVVLDGLDHADGCRLLMSALPHPLDRAVVDRMVAESRGNPRVLIESARAMTPQDPSGGHGFAAAGGTDEASLAGLAPQSRLLLVLAAAEPLGDPVRLWQAAARLGIAASAAEQLESRGLVSFGTWVTFRDPRLRQWVYGLALEAERRRVHGALAAVTDPVAEPDRHVWHRAQSLVGPDEAVGDELVRNVATARGRGGSADAAAFLARAVACTAVAELRVERAILAADAYHSAGAVDAAVRLLATAELGPVDATGRARVTRLRARMAFDATRGPAAIARLLESAQELEVPEPQVAGAAYLEALGAAVFTGHVDVVHTALTRLAAQRPSGTDRLLEGVAQRYTAGYAAAVESLKLALKTLDCDHEDDARSRLLACLVAPDLWDEDTWCELTATELAHARRAGARTILPYVLTHRALVEIHTGSFAVAGSLVDEARALTEAAGTPAFPHAASLLAAWRGRHHPAMAVPDGGRCGDGGIAVAMTRYATAVLGNGLGQYGDAVTATRRALEGDGIELQGWSLAELVEGAVRSGQVDTAAAALERLSERASLCGTEWALGVEARSRALLRTGSAAEELYVEAIGRLGRTRSTTELARAQLLYGEWLRRQGRRVDARVSLRAAQESFAAMGAEAFAGRAMRELLATGERARRRVPETQTQLTPQETRIATLARDGRSNPEIATTLSISPRTVEYHLHKVFTKLSITSRTELHLVLEPERRPRADSAIA